MQSQGTISNLIKDLSTLNGHGDRDNAINLTHISNEMFNESSKNPSLENLLKDVMKFTEDDKEEDPELKEIRQMIKDVIKEDLKLNSPFDMMAFAVKMMAAQNS